MHVVLAKLRQQVTGDKYLMKSIR